jgi:hypothetical protein
VTAAYDDVRQFGRLATTAEFGYRMRAVGSAVPVDESDHPYALLAAGCGCG